MFKVRWDAENNGIILGIGFASDQEIVPPRPVFHEELNLLGFLEYWSYPESTSPLLWAVGRKYYYRGECVAEAKGGSMYEAPKLVVHRPSLELEPIDVEKVVAANRDTLQRMENEAYEFIQQTYNDYRKRTDIFAVAFSGGKDSQVVLDLVSRVLGPKNYIVVFTDTTMELPNTYQVVEQTRRRYQERYPELAFYTAAPELPALHYWPLFGPPSRIHRWCCSVCKTVPFTQRVRDLYQQQGHIGVPRLVVFEGVRAEESARRSGYERIGNNHKSKQKNCEVILYWNVAEIYLYMFSRELLLHPDYRNGLTRVGCIVCPFSSTWSDWLIKSQYREAVEPFISIIREPWDLSGMSESIVREMLSQRKWKVRAGGRDLVNETPIVTSAENSDHIKVVITGQQLSETGWFRLLSSDPAQLSQALANGDGKTRISLLGKTAGLHVAASRITLVLSKSLYSKEELLRVKRIVNKAVYCIRCGYCSSVCLNNAIQQKSDGLTINQAQCKECSDCWTFSSHGCLLAQSLNITESSGGAMCTKAATSKYQTFGMRNEWMIDFLSQKDNWLQNNNLGKYQLVSAIAWLKDMGLLDNSNHTQPFFDLLATTMNRSENDAWSILWCQLAFESPLISWFVRKVPVQNPISSSDLVATLLENDQSDYERTAQNAIKSLMNLFEATPLSNMGIGRVTKRGSVRMIERNPVEVTDLVIGYCLYKYRERKGIDSTTISKLMEESEVVTPQRLFQSSTEQIIACIRSLDRKGLLSSAIKADLDNVDLHNMSAFEYLRRILMI
jgi:phosphoadenosine phosphosulfate reductase